MEHPTHNPLYAIVSPVGRLADAAPDVKVWGLAVALGQFIRGDLFTGAVLLVTVASAIDYLLGGRVARVQGVWNGDAARNGWVGKLSGILLCLLIRAFEGMLLAHADLNTHGALATGLAVSLFAVELQSIANHRESLGASPIPILSAILDWMQKMAGHKIPPAPGA